MFAGKDYGYSFLNFPAERPGSFRPIMASRFGVTYLAWIAGLIILFPLCYFYGEYKRT